MARKPKSLKSAAWSITGYPEIPDEGTHWERFLEAEHIEEKDIDDNPKVLDFIVKNAHRFYVPTVVLKMYDMEVEF